MKDIKKCLKDIKMFHFENIFTSLIAMKKNVEIKQKCDSFFIQCNNLEIIIPLINIYKNKNNFEDDLYLNILFNFQKIIKVYNESIDSLFLEINRINNIIQSKYLSETTKLFSNEQPELEEEKIMVELVNIDNILKQIIKM